MANRYKVTRMPSERTQLTELTRCGKPLRPSSFTPAPLLLCDAGDHEDSWKVADVAIALDISSRTVEHIKQTTLC